MMGYPRTTTVFPEPTWWNGDDDRDLDADDPRWHEECDHDDYDADILTGRAMCNICGYAWWQTAEEIEAEHRRQVEYAEWMDRENRRERWRQLFLPMRRAVIAAFRRHCVAHEIDDEIPF